MNKLITAVVIAGGLGLTAYAGNEALKMPDVHFSYSTDSCVKVINYTDEQFDCSNYPSKFNHVWVQ